MNKTEQLSAQVRLGLLFIGLAFGVIILVLTYFYYVLQPRLQQEAQTQATILTQSLSTEFRHKTVLDNAFLLQKSVGKLLLYNNEADKTPFIMGVQIEFNPELFPQHNRALQRGETYCPDCFKVVTPLYDQSSSDLLGSMTFYVNSKNYQSLISEISYKFFMTLFILASLLGLIWFVLRYLWQQSLISQTQLAESEKYNQQILDTMQDMLFLVDHQGRILDANLSAQHQLNESIKSLHSHLLQEYFETTEKKQPLLKAIKQQDSQMFEVRFDSATKSNQYGLLSSTQFDKPKTDQPRYLVVIKDIQALKTAEAKLAYQAQMAHASRLKSLGEMATGIAHEINQPLAVIRLGAEGIKQSLLMQHSESFEVEIAQDVIDQVDRATQIINNMRSFARLKPSPKNWIAPHHPTLSALSFFKEQLRVNNIELVENIKTNCPEILIETQKFEQVIVNLITNARHALDQINDQRIKQVEVEVKCDHEYVTIKIKDNGIGMDNATKQHCLDPFFTTKEAGEGTGLGLSIVHNILQEFNIQLIIETQLGRGTAFIMQIPHKLSGVSR